MGFLDEILHDVLLEAAAKRPELTEDKLTEIVEKTVVETLPKIAKTLWPSLLAMKEENLFRNRLEAEAFTKRNIFRWREGFDLMDMLGAISLEIGQTVNLDGELGERPSVGCKHRALVRLHAKACQIFSEIACLLKHGFADGALGRWRALHEVAVVASLLSAHDEDLAQRFLEFRTVESWKSMKVYQEKAETLGQEPFDSEAVEQIRESYKKLLSRYGDSFRDNYGWAASVVDPKPGSKRVTFKDLERAVGIEHLKPYYQWACQKIHVGCNTLHNSLGLSVTDGEEVMMAGPSNAGHADPAHLAAISLYTATCALNSLETSMDILVGCKVSGMLVDKIGEAFLRAHQQLEEEEAEGRRQATQEDEGLGGAS